MTQITLAPGESLSVVFKDTDGEFEIHFDTPEYKEQIVVKEIAGLSGSEVGEANAILYHEIFLFSDEEEESDLDEASIKQALSYNDDPDTKI